MPSLNMPNGPGEVLGDRLATGLNLTRLNTTAVDTLSYVGPTNADDTDTGIDPMRPLATIQKAYDNAFDNVIIVLMDGYSTSESLTIEKKVIFAAGGQDGGQPTVRWMLGGGEAGADLQIAVADVEFRNINFVAPSVGGGAARISVAGSDCLFRDCRFEMNGNDAGSAIILLDTNGDRCRFERCTFVVTSTSVASRPPAAIYRNDTAITRVDLIDCTFDGGTTGFDTSGGISRSGYCIDGGTGVGATKWRIENLTLLRGPDVRMPAGTQGHIQIQTNTGGSKLFVP